ncbi:MAG: hypothetical protein ACO3AD_18735 [Burkholderiaceae bacterium]
MTDNRLNESALEAVVIEIKKAIPKKRIKLSPKHVIVPHMTVVQVAEERGITVEEAREQIEDAMFKLIKKETGYE